MNLGEFHAKRTNVTVDIVVTVNGKVVEYRTEITTTSNLGKNNPDAYGYMKLRDFVYELANDFPSPLSDTE